MTVINYVLCLQAWESSYAKWQKLTYELVNFAKEEQSSLDVQKYLRRRTGSKITAESLEVDVLYTGYQKFHQLYSRLNVLFLFFLAYKLLKRSVAVKWSRCQSWNLKSRVHLLP